MGKLFKKLSLAEPAGGGGESGTYTPATRNALNVTVNTVWQCRYSRIGDFVTVSGAVDINTAATGEIQIGIALPVASSFAEATSVGGAAATDSTSQDSNGFAVSADATENDAVISGYVDTGSSFRVYFIFSYMVT